MTETLAGLWTPHPGQAEVMASHARTRVIACGRRWGKTEVCAAEIVERIHRGPPTRTLVVAPTLAQAQLIFQRVRRLHELVCRHYHVPPENTKIRQSPYPLLTYDGHEVAARSGHARNSIRGDEATHILVDEAAFVPEALITESLWPMMATHDGQLTLISTPQGFNFFWRMFTMGQTGANGVWSYRAPSAQNPAVSAQFLAVQRALVSQRTFAVEYEAEFQDAAGTLISAELINHARTPEPEIAARVHSGHAVVIGVDWAQTHDYTAVAVVAGSTAEAWVLLIQRVPRGTWDVMIRAVAAIIAAYPRAVVVADATGVGGPTTEELRAAIRPQPVRPFTFDAQSKGRLVERLVAQFERRAIRIPPDDLLQRELLSYRCLVTRGGVTYGNGTGGTGHDDLVTAVALALAHLPNANPPRIQTV